MADVTEVLNKAENKEELKAVLPLSAKQESAIFQQITTELAQQNDFEAFLNRKVHFDNRDWTYGQFLYKHCFDEVQKFTYQCKDYFDGKPVANFGETEKNLAQKVAFIFSNNLAQPDGVLQIEKLKELDIFNGDKDKEAFYQNLFANSNRSVDGNPCYWHPISQYQTLVIENELSKIGMNSEQIRDLMVHCEKEREKAERFYKDNMPTEFVHNSKVSPEEMGNTVQTRLRSVDSAITTQKYCFIAEPNSFHSGLPMQGDKEFKSWPRFSPKVMAFQMSATEFADKTKDSYNYIIDMSQRDAIQPCIPLWGGAPSEWVSVKDLSYSPDVEKETLQDLQKQGMKFYLVPNKGDWDLLRQAENLSENEAEIFMQKLCQEGKAVLFDNKNANQNAWNIAFDEKTGEFVEVNDKTGEHRAFQQEQEFKSEPEKPSKAPEMKFNPTSMEFEYANPKLQEIAERRRELNHTKQDILALKERIAKQGLEEIGLEGKMGQTGNSRATNPNEAVTETHKKVAESQIEDLKPFIKNYLEQRRSK